MVEIYREVKHMLRSLCVQIVLQLHYDDQSGRYLDYGLHTEEACLSLTPHCN